MPLIVTLDDLKKKEEKESNKYIKEIPLMEYLKIYIETQILKSENKMMKIMLNK